MDVNVLAITVLLGSFFIMIFLRVPIAYAVGLSTIFCLASQGLSFTTLCQHRMARYCRTKKSQGIET